MSRIIQYSPKICEICKKEYSPTGSKQRVCKNCLVVKCLYCGELFSVEKYSKIATRKFCNRKCQGEYASKYCIGENSKAYKNGNRTKIEIACANCGKTTMKEKKFIDKYVNSYCNQNCYNQYQRKHPLKGENSPIYSRITVYCEWCNKEYKVMPCYFDETRFCSKKCRNDWQSDMMSGDKHHNWKGGISPERHIEMSNRNYRQWRTSVFERDSYTCQKCGDNKGGNLNAHHIERWVDNKEKRYELSNGITLCIECHKKAHSIS